MLVRYHLQISLVTLLVISSGIITVPRCFSQNSPHYRLGTGTASSEGNYFRVGNAIAEALGSTSADFQLDVVPTQGSVDNIEQLLRGDLDIAIVQNDVAFAAERGLPPFDAPENRLRAVAMLYPEPVIALTNTPILTILRPPLPPRIAVGSEGSGLFYDVKTILSAAEAWDPVTARYLDPKLSARALLEEDVGLGFFNTIPDTLVESIRERHIRAVPLAPTLVERLRATYSYMSPYIVVIGTDSVLTVAVRAMLVTVDNLPSHVVEQLVSTLRAQPAIVRSFPKPDDFSGESDFVTSMPLNAWHPAAETLFEGAGLIEPQPFKHISWIFWVIPLLLVVAYTLLNGFLFSFGSFGLHLLPRRSRLVSFARRLNLIIISQKYIVLLICIILGFIFILLTIQSIERDWAIRHNTLSIFEERPFMANLLWLFVFGVSGYNDSIFPVSPLAKFFATLIPLIGFGGVLTLIGFVTTDKIKSHIMQAKGLLPIPLQDHIIICGWNEDVPYLVQNLLHSNIARRRPIALLCEAPEEFPVRAHNLNEDLVRYVKGSATNTRDLDKANLAEADTAIIVTEKSDDPDARSILKVLAIEQYCRQLETDRKRDSAKGNIYTIVEIVDAKNHEVAKAADVDEIISFGHIKSSIVVQAALNHGVSSFIEEILTFNEYNDLYSYVIPADSALVDRTYDELLTILRRDRVLLLSISVKNQEACSTGQPDSAPDTDPKLSRAVLTNPLDDVENDYRTKPGDRLIMLAKKERNMLDAVANTEKILRAQ